jgi:putative SOS response-associated peptidase YedK
MCYQTKITKQKQELERSFQAKITGMDDYVPSPVFKAFDFPKTPVITKDDPELIQLYQWGLVPNWAGSDWNRNYTLNARIETLDQKKSFQNVIENRCLVIVNGFYEWQHIEKNKIKYEIGFSDELFALGGLYEHSEQGSTYTIVTTEARGVMREIHNTKLRMPFALQGKESMEAWLSGNFPEPDYDFTTSPELYQQTRLF